jgi:gas vesicle structural protein
MVLRAARETGMVDLLDRILDKGIVIDVSARVILAGVDLGFRFEVRMVVASIDTYLKYAGAIKYAGPIGVLKGI